MPAKGQSKNPLEKFWAKVDVQGQSDCWEWVGGRNPEGYGVFKPDTRRDSPQRHKVITAHRFSAQLFFGDLSNYFVCHHCDNPSCVNPNHLYLGTALENAQDRIKRNRDYNANKTHCPKGHEYTPENTYRPHGEGTRFCRECGRIENQKYYKKFYENRAGQLAVK